MENYKVDLALEIMELKIIHYIKTYNKKDKEEFQNELKKLIDERERVFNLDKDAIDRVYNIYLEEIKKGEIKWESTI